MAERHDGQPTPGMRAFAPVSIAAGVLTVPLLFTLPPVYTRLSSAAVFGCVLFCAVQMFANHHRWLGVCYLAVGILINPFLSYAMPGVIWVALAGAAGVYCLVVPLIVRGPGPQPDPPELPDRLF